MVIFDIIRLWFHNPYFTGLLPDPRTGAEKLQDYAHSEREYPTAADPFSNQNITQSPYPYFNQLSTSSCVPHAVGLALEIERKNDVGDLEQISPIFIYRQRSNYPGEGSYPPEIYGLYKKNGAPLLTTLPTPQYEVQANSVILTPQMFTEAQIFKGKTYWTVDTGYNDISKLANIAAQGHGVTITLYATEAEYSREYPVILNPSLNQYAAEIRHEICILPNSGFMKDGIKYVTAQDSAWFGGWKIRHLSEEFIRSRVTGAGYWDTVSALGSGSRPHYNFTLNLQVGSRSSEVKVLQTLLISEGFLPSDCATGYFGGITLAGVKAFQSKYSDVILTPVGLSEPTGYWGPSSRKQANILCN